MEYLFLEDVLLIELLWIMKFFELVMIFYNKLVLLNVVYI